MQAAHTAGVTERAERRGRQAPEHLGRVRRAARTESAGRCGQKEVRRRHRLPRPRQHEHLHHVTSTATSRQPSITPTECITATTTMRITTCLDEWVIYSIGSKPSVTSHYTSCSHNANERAYSRSDAAAGVPSSICISNSRSAAAEQSEWRVDATDRAGHVRLVRDAIARRWPSLGNRLVVSKRTDLLLDNHFKVS